MNRIQRHILQPWSLFTPLYTNGKEIKKFIATKLPLKQIYPKPNLNTKIKFQQSNTKSHYSNKAA